MSEIGYKIEELVEIVNQLRGPDGCPWDREQTSHSLIPYFVEEVYEVIESIDERNWDSLKEELGDLLLHIIFQASIAEKDEKFKFVSAWEYNDDPSKPILHKEDLEYEDIEIKTRSYK